MGILTGTGEVLNLDDLISADGDGIATGIANQYNTWQMLRREWLDERAELERYITATDTRSTSAGNLPWKNSTTVPKLTQIRDNLHANYMAALFPHRDWLRWEADTREGAVKDKRDAIQNYMKTKVLQDRTELVVEDLLLDYIDYGNCFATAEWVDESSVDPVTGESKRGYIGPRLVRLSPIDVVFNPAASDFRRTPKIIRTVKSLGEIKKRVLGMEEGPERAMLQKALDRGIGLRRAVSSTSGEEQIKSELYQVDGFSSLHHYFSGEWVEILTFYGDLYDVDSGEFFENHVIQVMDRAFILSKEESPDWTTQTPIFHAGWRKRPDNLYGMGPLDNLVGMQYRIDHLENLKADVFDMIAHPQTVIHGYVEDWEPGPGAKIIAGDDGKVEHLSPDATALKADFQIDRLEQRMEEMAGAPKQAMGIRTPGEKTAFEVQTLDNASGRIFQNKIGHFERTFWEPALNYMLQLARQHMQATDVVRTLDSEVSAIIYSTIKKEDIVASGLLRPVGASHFARRANILQNLNNLTNTTVFNDEEVKVHTSAKKLAQVLLDLTDLDNFDIYSPFIRISERQEGAQQQTIANEEVDLTAATPTGVLEADDEGTPPG